MNRKLKIGLANFTLMTYSVETPYNEPLGGSESALCYLAEHLARHGHKITIFGNLPYPFIARNVRHEPKQDLIKKENNFDFFIIQNTPLQGLEIKKKLSAKTKLIFWSQHASDQPAVQCLKEKEIKEAFDAFILISYWQLMDYRIAFKLKPSKCFILRNAISPAFENLFTTDKSILLAKAKPPVLVYTSTPFRGLNLLIKLFPLIREQIPQARLKVFSSLKVYQASKEEDKKSYGKLYETCQRITGVEYVGSISQTKLSQELKKALIFAYPNTFAETSCISAMEAMAAGCQIVTTHLGALAETTAGFAKLIPISTSQEQYCQNFVNETVNILRKFLIGDHEELSDTLVRQVNFANNCYTWEKRAWEWEMLLKLIS